MRRLVFALAFLLSAARLDAAVAFVQFASDSTPSGTPSVLAATLSSTVTNGGTIVACAFIFNASGAPTGNGITDDKGNTYTSLQAQSTTAEDGGDSRHECYAATNITGGATVVVSWTASTGTVVGTMHAVEFSGTAAAGAVQTSNIATFGNINNPSGTAIVASGAGMHVSYLGYDNSVTHTPGAGWTEAVESGQCVINYRTAANGVSQTPSSSLSSTALFGRYIHLVLLESGGGGGGVLSGPVNLPTVGVGGL